MSIRQSISRVAMAGLCGLLLTTFAIDGHAQSRQSYGTKKFQKHAVRAAGLSNKKIERAIEFIIPKNYRKKLNTIQWTWKAGRKGRPILSGNHYQLVNLVNNRGLKRNKRRLSRAADLGFLKSSSKKFNMLIKRKKGDGQLRYGNTIALNLKPYGWLKHKKRGKGGGWHVGGSKKTPHFIWQIRGGKRGTKVFSGMPFALYNLKPKKAEILFCQRTFGIDLQYRGKSKCGSKWAKISAKAWGPNGALSGDGLAGKYAKKWKARLCQAGVGAAATYATAQTSGAGAVAVKAAVPIALKKCNKL